MHFIEMQLIEKILLNLKSFRSKRFFPTDAVSSKGYVNGCINLNMAVDPLIDGSIQSDQFHVTYVPPSCRRLHR